MSRWCFAGATDRGQVREQNEDALSVRHGALGAFVVADGLGGHQGGEVASRLAVECLEGELEKIVNAPEWASDPDPGQIEARLTQAMLQANATVLTAAKRNPELGGMGCTLLAALVRGDRAIIAHVGDVRAYLWRAGTLTQLTADHTEVAALVTKGLLSPEEARHYPFRHHIERAVGVRRNLAVDVRSVEVNVGDRLLFCSDGLWNMLDEARLSAALAEEREAEACVKRLVREANDAGGEDNITTIVVDLIEEGRTNAMGAEGH